MLAHVRHACGKGRHVKSACAYLATGHLFSVDGFLVGGVSPKMEELNGMHCAICARIFHGAFDDLLRGLLLVNSETHSCAVLPA